jgi:hypothetical protein
VTLSDKIDEIALESERVVQELVIAKARDEARKAKAEADLAELILEYARQHEDKLALPKIGGAS